MRIVLVTLWTLGGIYATWRAYRFAECATVWFLRLLSGQAPEDEDG